MNLKGSLITALVLSFASILLWEIYWRSQGKVPDIDDDKNLWADQRAEVNRLTKDDVILTGSSRVLFDIQIYEWEKITGKRPIQLATVGSTPLPVFRDIVEKTDFAGTIIVGVTPGLFFSTINEKAGPFRRPNQRIKHFYNRTYAQRLNHFLSMPLQKNFVFVATSEEEWASDIDLKSLLRNIKFGNRTGEEPFPPFYQFDLIDENRNNRMTERTATDTAFAGTVKKVWGFMGKTKREPQKDSTIAYFTRYAEKFMQRGGNIILLRCPVSGLLKERETTNFPREEFWDELLKQSGVKGYNFEDYEQFSDLQCPEWSHLSAQDADFFTREIVKIMLADGALTDNKTN
ncbi:MAG: hypothetical protein IPM42_11325 [Saprospiraceae bacterium]|nr:hypothetical protein [Saprospiraceae bacterium]